MGLEQAKTIPSETTPRNFVFFKLATTITFLLSNVSFSISPLRPATIEEGLSCPRLTEGGGMLRKLKEIKLKKL